MRRTGTPLSRYNLSRWRAGCWKSSLLRSLRCWRWRTKLFQPSLRTSFTSRSIYSPNAEGSAGSETRGFFVGGVEEVGRDGALGESLGGVRESGEETIL